MKKLLYLTLIVSIFALQVKSQNANSLIKIHNVANISQMNAIANPSIGNIVYVTAISKMYQYDGSNWLAVDGSSTTWNITGNVGTSPTTNFVGTTDNQALTFRVNNVEKLRLETRGSLTPINTGNSIYIGRNAGLNDDLTSNHNIGLGLNALFNNTTGHNNIANGNNVLYSNTSGHNNTAIGFNTLYKNTTGINNIGFGYLTLYYNTIGSFNIANGYLALYRNISGEYNIASGRNALISNTTGSHNIASGRGALYSNTSGNYNIANGYRSLYFNSTGVENVAIGNRAGNNNASGSRNIFIGNQAGYFETTSDKLYIDNSDTTSPLIYGNFASNSLKINGTLTLNNAYTFPSTDGNANQVLQTDGSGNLSWQNTASDSGSGWSLTGNNETNPFTNFLGTTDNNDLSIKTNNTERLIIKTGSAAKARVLFPKIVFNPISGLLNSAVLGINGDQGRLRITAGNDDTFDNSLGASVDLHGNNAQDEFRGRLDLVAGSGATNQAINIFTGNMLRATFLSNGNFGINDPNPSQQLVVNGSAGKPGGGSWATISDKRLKRNINPYKKGLSEILKVEPVNFQYNNKSNAYDLDKTYVGVIAQEIEKILPSTVTVTKDKDLKDMRTFDSSELTWTMINAIKELNKKIEFLENEIIELKK